MATFSNANSAIRRSAWEEQPFDESLPGGEDLAWASRQVARGKKVSYVYDAAVCHSHMEPLREVHRRHRVEAPAHEWPGKPRLGEYLREWVHFSRRDVARLARAGAFRWAAWAPLYYGARLSGEYRGRRALTQGRR
jgi:hypothetical protein